MPARAFSSGGDASDDARPKRHSLLRDQIVQSVLFERAANLEKLDKAIVIDVGAYYGVSRSYIYRCLKEVEPERRKQIVESIIKIVFFGEALALAQILAAPVVDTTLT